ncbi:MAG: tetratricopeptide repeat protein [Bryobacterales bacterium]|nr:tetratricopeptide repeat protein [Bryobacterales bacterium]
MHRIGLALVLAVATVALNGQGSTGEQPFPVQIRALNEKGGVAGYAYAIPIPGGYVTVRGLLAGAYRAELVEGERTQAITTVRGEDVERNLVVIGTEMDPSAVVELEPLAVTEPAQWKIRCGTQGEISVKEFVVRDLPAFGLVYLGRTAHGDTISGCPAWNEDGRWSGMVVWESPMARPSVVMVPASLAVPLAQKPEMPWEQWRAAQVAEGVRFRNSLLAEALQDIWRAQYASAIDNFSVLLEKHPADGRAWYYRGYAKAMSGDRAGAIEDYERAVQHDPTNADAHFSLGFSYLLLRRKLEATEQAKELDAIDEVMAMKLRMLIEAMSEPSPRAVEDFEPDADSGSPAEPPLDVPVP